MLVSLVVWVVGRMNVWNIKSFSNAYNLSFRAHQREKKRTRVERREKSREPQLATIQFLCIKWACIANDKMEMKICSVCECVCFYIHILSIFMSGRERTCGNMVYVYTHMCSAPLGSSQPLRRVSCLVLTIRIIWFRYMSHACAAMWLYPAEFIRLKIWT